MNQLVLVIIMELNKILHEESLRYKTSIRFYIKSINYPFEFPLFLHLYFIRGFIINNYNTYGNTCFV